MEITNEDQLKVMKKLEEVLNFLKKNEIKNKESLKNIDKPLDDLLSSLKYLPIDSPFSFLPTEITTDILEYLCRNGTILATSVCQEWKEILSPQVKEMGLVQIGKHCSNEYECEDGKCYLPEAMIKALPTLELDANTYVCHPLTHVDPQIVSEGLSSVSRLSLMGDCDCVGDDYDSKPILTGEQKEQLLVALENRSEDMGMLELRAMDLNNLDQERLVNFLINKNGHLRLDEAGYGPILDIRKFVKKLKDTTDYELELDWLRLNDVEYPDDLAEDMADVLCRLAVFSLREHFRPKTETLKRLLENILTLHIKTIGFRILNRNTNWDTLINPADLKTVVDKMSGVELRGTFTPEQLEAARSCPGAHVNLDRISKNIGT